MKTLNTITVFDKYRHHFAAREKLVQQLKRHELVKVKNELPLRQQVSNYIEKRAQKLLQSRMLKIPPPPPLDAENFGRVYSDIQIVDHAIAAQKRISGKNPFRASTLKLTGLEAHVPFTFQRIP